MILQGVNLIIKAGGVAIAAAKSANIKVQAKTIEVSSPTGGQWEHSIVGRKSWSVSTSHLVALDVQPTHKVQAVGTCNKDGAYDSGGSIMLNGQSFQGASTRGLQLNVFSYVNNSWVSSTPTTYDTYGDIDTECAAMITDVNNLTSGSLVVITSYDAYGMTAALAQAVSTKLGILLATIPTINPSMRASFACIGIVGSGGIAMCNKDEGSVTHIELLLGATRVPIRRTPVKDMLQKAGQTFTIQIQVDGLAEDRLSGTVHCKSAGIQGTKGNLMTGSFDFVGTGPLE
jgi:hypothetical protein